MEGEELGIYDDDLRLACGVARPHNILLPGRNRPCRACKSPFHINWGRKKRVCASRASLGKVKHRYQNQVSDLQETWTDNSVHFGFKTYGFTVSGQMAVEPAEVRFDAKIPLAAMMFKGKIEQTLRDEINRVLA